MPSSGGQKCALDRKSTRLNSSHGSISYAVFCLKKHTHSCNRPPLLRLAALHLCPGRDLLRPAAAALAGWDVGTLQTSNLRGHVYVFFLNGAPPPTPALFPPRAPCRI